jgi:hypothetical protein
MYKIGSIVVKSAISLFSTQKMLSGIKQPCTPGRTRLNSSAQFRVVRELKVAYRFAEKINFRTI